MNISCDKALLALLQKSEKAEVDYLVDALTDNGNGRVALSSAVKDLLLAEKHEAENYSEQALRHLLHEFQTFGGHSLMNFLRSEPLGYEELLTDVHKKLNGKESKKKPVASKEREIVLALFGAEWRTLPAAERFARSSEKKVILGFFNINENLNFDEKGLAIGFSAVASAAVFIALRSNPIAATISSLALLTQSAGEAYRVTIPFVVQLAWIKMARAG